MNPNSEKPYSEKDPDIMARLANTYKPLKMAAQLREELQFAAKMTRHWENSEKYLLLKSIVFLVLVILFTTLLMKTKELDNWLAITLLIFYSIANIFSIYKLLMSLNRYRSQDLAADNKYYCGLTQKSLVLIIDKACLSISYEESAYYYLLQSPVFIPIESLTAIKTFSNRIAIYTNTIHPIYIYLSPKQQVVFKDLLFRIAQAEQLDILNADIPKKK
jgi:hypothetical protein